MIYLENNTSKQLIYIPKNEDGCITHKAPSDCGECFNEGVAYAKSLMQNEEFVQNGDYQNNNGWSAITVNVPDSANLEAMKNVTIDQDVTFIYPSSGYDGMMSVFVDASEYGQQQYEDGVDDGFVDGYSSGYTEGSDAEKAKLGTTGFTLNGNYIKNEGGWSSVTVNVEQSGHTDEELINAYNSGYTSGETHQKSLLTTTAFTKNGRYSNENGWSDVIVDVGDLNVEPNKSFTATSNGEYTIMSTSAITTINDRFDSDNDIYYLTATTSGYPSVGRFHLFIIEDESDSSKGSIIVAIEDGEFIYGNEWRPYEDANIWSDSHSIYIVINNANSNIDWHPLESFYYYYNSMSAVTVTVDVPSGMDITLSAIKITENTAITASTGTAFSSITVDIPEPQCPDFNDGELAINTNGTYLADDYGYDGFSSVTVNVPSDYGELYCLYCEDAVWGSDVATPINYSGLCTIYANVLDDSGMTYTLTGYTSYGNTAGSLHYYYDEQVLTAKLYKDYVSLEYSGQTDSEYFGDFYKVFPNTSQYYLDYLGGGNGSDKSYRYYLNNYTQIPTRKPIRYNLYGTLSGSRYYLFRISNTSFCGYDPGVDDNGYGALRISGGTLLRYPSEGYAWPVYRKKVNGVWKYTIVKQIVL